MTTYQFITANNEENRRGIVYLAISQEIETLAMSDTYGNYGQQVSPVDAGDYCELLTENAVKVANEYNQENDIDDVHVIGDIINAYDNHYLYDHISENCADADLEFQKSGLKGFNYWDGSNWATVSVDADYGDTSHKLIEDEELIQKLNKAIQDMEFVKEGFGKQTFKTDEYVIIQSQFADAFESYKIFPISEHEFLNEENN
jgi:hypothetical protein